MEGEAGGVASFGEGGKGQEDEEGGASRGGAAEVSAGEGAMVRRMDRSGGLGGRGKENGGLEGRGKEKASQDKDKRKTSGSEGQTLPE